MASNDTAALVVALSAQVSKFEKDMLSAVAIADKRTKEIETRFGAMNTAITGKLSELGASAASQIGFAGTLLRTLGPAGIAAAAGIGVAVGGIYALAEATAAFAEKSKALKEGAETAGLTITQFKLLGQAGSKVGLDFEETSAFFTKFIANIEALRQGGGPLFDALLKIDAGLLRQLSVTKDSAAAINILVEAYKRLDDQSKKLDLSRAAGGRAGLSGGRLLESLGNQGGLSGLEANSPTINEDQIKRAAQLKVEIDAINKKAQNIWGSMFSDEVLSKQRQTAEGMLQIAQLIDRIVNGRRDLASLPGGGVGGPDDFTLPPGFGPGAGVSSGKGGRAPGVSFNDRFSDRAGPAIDQPLRPFVPAPTNTGGAAPAVELAILQKNLALLGEAVTQGEQWKLKKLEIAAAAEKGGVSQGIESRALDAFRVSMIAAATATRERLGIATEQQIVESRNAQLAQDAIKFNLTENEVLRAKNVILLEAKQASDALAVRRSYLPGLKQLELDALSARKGLDTLATNSLNNLETALVDVVTGTKTAKEAFKAMANAIIADLARIAIRKAIIGPLAGGLGSLFGDASLPVGKNASGTNDWRGGPTWIGENGPEILNLPKGSQIIPNNIATRGGSASPSIVYSPSYHFDAGIGPSDMALISAQIRASEQRTRSDVVNITRGTLRNDRDALTRG